MKQVFSSFLGGHDLELRFDLEGRRSFVEKIFSKERGLEYNLFVISVHIIEQSFLLVNCRF